MRKIADDEFVLWLDKQLKARNFSIRDAARKIGVSHTTIAETLQANRMPSFDTFEALSRAFGVPTHALMVMAGAIAPESQEYDPIYEELLSLYRQMTEDQKDEFMAIARIKAQSSRRSSKSGNHKSGDKVEKVEGRGT
jgi:transcriptional regulator with XRE-family HTH domain